MLKWIVRVVVLLLLLVAAFVMAWIGGQRGWLTGRNNAGPIPKTPAWALEPWIWEDDVNTAAFVEELVKGYEEHDIPFRTILIDSPWSTRYNDFIVDEKIYPSPKEFFLGLQDRGYRVVLWMTSMVNSESDDTAIKDSQDWFRDAAGKGYLAGGDYQWKWWKGRGGFIDYTNPEAMQWWRGLQQNVFDWGLDGWKLDDAAAFFSSSIGKLPVPYQRTHAGWMTTRTYMDHYYRDEYQHGLTQNKEFITLSRSLDAAVPFLQNPGFAPFDAAPVNWVGDQDHAWTPEDEGIEEALTSILDSATLGYNIIGSDIGGYSGGDIPKNVYIRWAQFSTFCGLFLNGGHGERRLWLRSPEELEIIRECHWLHRELVPYIYHYVIERNKGGAPLMRPLDARYHYMFGDAFLVAPIYEDTLTRTVTLPEGRWRYWYDDLEVIEGPTTVTRDFPLDEFPVYVRDGAIIPMNISRDYTGVGARDWEGFVTLNLYPHGTSKFTVHLTDDSGLIEVTMEESGDTIDLLLDGAKERNILRILSPRKPSKIERDGFPLTENTDWTYDAEKQRLVVRTMRYTTGNFRISF